MLPSLLRKLAASLRKAAAKQELSAPGIPNPVGNRLGGDLGSLALGPTIDPVSGEKKEKRSL